MVIRERLCDDYRLWNCAFGKGKTGVVSARKTNQRWRLDSCWVTELMLARMVMMMKEEEENEERNAEKSDAEGVLPGCRVRMAECWVARLFAYKGYWPCLERAERAEKPKSERLESLNAILRRRQ